MSRGAACVALLAVLLAARAAPTASPSRLPTPQPSPMPSPQPSPLPGVAASSTAADDDDDARVSQETAAYVAGALVALLVGCAVVAAARGGGCCGGEKESEDDAAAAAAAGIDGDGDTGPLAGASGRCTDCLCLLALLGAWLAMSALGAVVMGFYDLEALPAGDPRRLLYGMDYLGDICSVDANTKASNSSARYRKYDVSKRPYSSVPPAFLFLFERQHRSSFGCISNITRYYLPSGALVCVDDCPAADDAARFVCTYAVQEDLDAKLAAGDVDAYWKAGLEGVFAYECNFEWATTEFLTYCVFDAVPDVAGSVEIKMFRIRSTWSNVNRRGERDQPDLDISSRDEHRSKNERKRPRFERARRVSRFVSPV